MWFLESGEVRVGMSRGRIGRTLKGSSKKVVQVLKVTCHMAPFAALPDS